MFSERNLFAFENGLDPKKPLNAERGEGWADLSIRCLGDVIKEALLPAFAPQSIKTMGFSELLRIFIILSVNVLHPISLWLLAAPFLTVRVAFRSKTPCFAEEVRSP